MEQRPWRRREYGPHFWHVWDHSYKLCFLDYEDVNMDLDPTLKKIALKVSASVVSIITYSGEKRLFAGSGILFESNYVDGIYHGRILSSATLLKNAKHDITKVEVYLQGEKLHEGQIIAHSMAYNLLLLNIQSNLPLSPANLKQIDDSFQVRPKAASFQLRPHSEQFRIFKGDTLLALGRHYKKKYGFMVAAGLFSVEPCKFHCKELLRVNLRISQSGIGGPIVNRDGQVLGISFYASQYTPFLPSNVILKWLDHCNQNIVFSRPQLGVQLASLFTAHVGITERFVNQVYDYSNGVIVLEVEEGSSFDIAGIERNDVIVECCGATVGSLLQLVDMAREKAGQYVELVVIRQYVVDPVLRFSVVLAENSSDELNSCCWTLPKRSMRMKRRLIES